ncbi:MAG: Atxe2 family lasso peptide isopeptidase [Sphingomonas sp.]|jgi:dipeptidyl aminopeptidase/acylaminoacyl peptidase|uniref:Atxe2 family lasso peptide isopeptidase n=1 Tax=Sphingomonas sp. TaxID=28214 RepID=UPI0035681B14
MVRILLAGVALFGAAPASAATADCAARLLPMAPPRPGTELTAQALVELRDFGGAGAKVGGEPPFRVSPDGRWAALILRRADVARDDYCYGLLLVPLSGHDRPRLLDIGGDYLPLIHDLRGVADFVNGAPRMNTPVWSPDGRFLAYLRRDHGSTQIWAAGLDGAPARQISRLATDATAVRWSADGKMLAVRSRPGLVAAQDAIRQEGWGGLHFDKRFVPLSDNHPRPSSAIPFVDTWYDAATGRTVGSAGQEEGADPSKPRDAVLFARTAGGLRAWTAPRDPKALFPPVALHVAIADREILCPAALCADHVAALWWVGPADLLFIRAGYPANGGRDEIYRWHVTGKRPPVRLLSTVDALIGCQLADVRLICARESAGIPRRLVSIDVATARSALLFDPNPDFPIDRLGAVERLAWHDAQGVASYGDLVLPPDHKPGQRHPLIVVQYQSRGFVRGGTGDEYPLQLFAQHGFAVLGFQRPSELSISETVRNLTELQRANIAGFTERRMIVSALETGVDAAIARGVVDPDRLGLTGLSDGAVTAQFILSRPNRFKAASISTCCDDPGSAMSAAGLGYRDDVISWGYPGPGAAGQDFWRGYSLAMSADAVKTPILMQLADDEFRLALETYSTLQYRHLPVDMFVFPDEHHYKWHPAHRLAIYERNLAWFNFWLRGVRDPAQEADIKRWATMASTPWAASFTPGPTGPCGEAQ